MQKIVQLHCLFCFQGHTSGNPYGNQRCIIVQLLSLFSNSDNHYPFIIFRPFPPYQSRLLHLLEHRCQRSGIKEKQLAHFLDADGLMFSHHHHRYILGVCKAKRLKQRVISSDNLLCASIKRKAQLALEFQHLVHRSFNISLSIFSGFVAGAYRSTTFPSREMRNFVKFHFMSLPRKPPFCFLRKSNRGSAFFPFTSIFANNGKVVLYFNVQNSCISSSVPGAW